MSDANEALKRVSQRWQGLGADLVQDNRRLHEALVRAEAQVREQDAEIQRLQAALSFWLPTVPDSEHPAHERIAADTALLYGCHAPVVDGAEDIGWITLQPVPSAPSVHTGVSE